MLLIDFDSQKSLTDAFTKNLNDFSSYKTKVDLITDILVTKANVVADLLFLGNRVKHNTSSSRECVEQINKFDDLLVIIQEKELINWAMLAKKSFFYVTDNKLDKKPT